MKDNDRPLIILLALAGMLLAAQAIGAAASVMLLSRHVAATRELRTLQAQTVSINNNRAMLRALASDVFEYSKKHPDIEPILVSLSSKVGRSATTNPATPVAK
jgi:hypothetical protein